VEQWTSRHGADRTSRPSPPDFSDDITELTRRVARLSHRRGRVLLGITGEPGAGKSTLASGLVAALHNQAVVVPLDGYHLANALLASSGREARKGAIDTFDLAGYRAMMQRLRQADEEVVYAPAYVRDIEESIAASIAVDQSIPIVITEGNYLLAEHPQLEIARSLLDEVWYVETDDETRIRQLIDRHATFGKTPEQATAWATGSDEANAGVIRATRHRADLIVRLPGNIAPVISRKIIDQS
jgi:pantothenate kinase